MRVLTPLIILLVVAGIGCTDSDNNEAGGAETASVSTPAKITPDDVCRNDAIAVGDGGRWRLTDDLPAEWQGRTEVAGIVEESGDGEWFFVADGERLAATDNLTAPPMCVPWNEPSQPEDG